MATVVKILASILSVCLSELGMSCWMVCLSLWDIKGVEAGARQSEWTKRGNKPEGQLNECVNNVKRLTVTKFRAGVCHGALRSAVEGMMNREKERRDRRGSVIWVRS